MECMLVFFIIIALLVAAAGGMARGTSGVGQRRRTYQRIAKQRSARLTPGGLLRRPALLVRHGETRAVLREVPGGGLYRVPSTQVRIDSPDPRLNCDIFPANDAEFAPRIRRLERLLTGDPDFDQRYVFRGGQSENLEKLLTDGLRWQVSQLAGIADERFYVRFHRGQIVLQKPGLIRDYETLDEFLVCCLDLYDQYMLTRAEGIDFVTSETIQTLEQVECKVCGEEIVSEMVYCKRCKTPHHAECWQYTGSCSVYGCHETQCLQPKTGERT